MALNNNLIPRSILLVNLPQQKIAQTISLLLLFYIAFLAAKITWFFVPQEQTINSRVYSHHVDEKQRQQTDLSSLQALNLFGQYNHSVEKVVEQVQVQNAPQTRLQLTLSAAVASDKKSTAAAIIEYQGKQETYGVGDKIVGTNASLEQVLIDRVIIKQSGRLETLMLDGADYNQPAETVANKALANNKSATQQSQLKGKFKASNIVDQRLNKNLSSNAANLRADLTNNPSKITDYLRISPARKNGEIVGYRLSAGKKSDFFKQSGIKSGDIAVQMNGYDLLIPLEAAQAMLALKTERDISLLVNRNNDLVEILFSID
ncbi:MAG: type II secretion system protein GspC [Colwellia sp.]|nr:type II secretion system protein GspC [Colwellia sp.]